LMMSLVLVYHQTTLYVMTVGNLGAE
jgi:hypothetical protein